MVGGMWETAIAPGTAIAAGSFGRSCDARELSDELYEVLSFLAEREEDADKRLEHHCAQNAYRFAGDQLAHWKQVRHRIQSARRVLDRMIDDLAAGRLAVVS